MTKFAPPIWESVRASLRDGTLHKLASVESQLKQQNLGSDLKRAIEAQIFWARGQHEEAKRRLLEPGEGGPPGPYSKLILGHFALDTGDVNQAAQLFEGASQGGVTDPRLAAGKGAVALARNNGKEAQKWLRQSLEQDEKNWHARYLLGLALVAAGDARGGREAFERVTRERPDHEPSWLGYAAKSVELGLGGEAAKAIEKIAKKHADRPPLQMAFADCLRQAGDLDRAIDVLTPLASKSKDPEFILDYCELCLAAGHASVAEASIEVVEALDKDSGRARILRGHIAEMSQPRRFEEAALCYRKAIEVEPKNARAKIALGLLLMRETPIRDPAEAGRLFEAAIADERPPDVAALLNLAILRLSEGRSAEAKKLATEVLSRNPARPGILEQAKGVLAAIG